MTNKKIKKHKKQHQEPLTVIATDILNLLVVFALDVCPIIYSFMSPDVAFYFSLTSKKWRECYLRHLNTYFGRFYEYHAKTWKTFTTPFYPWLAGPKSWAWRNKDNGVLNEMWSRKAHRPSFVLWCLNV